LGIRVTNQSLIYEEIKSTLNLGNACYSWVQKLSSSHLVSGNVKIKLYKTIILPVVLYGYETWFLTSKEKHGLKVRTGWWGEYWDPRGRNNRRLEKIAQWGASWLVPLAKYY
jgi:hypothetical protein